MKKSTTVIAVIIIVIIVALVGVYAILTGKARAAAEEAVMTPTQVALNRDLSKDYPATVKEVVKYCTDLEKCLYNEEVTEEEFEQLAMQTRRLYDSELLAINEVGTYLVQLKAEVDAFKTAKRRIAAIAVAASTNVDFFSEDGYDFARIYCGYTYSEAGRSFTVGRVYLLRRDEDRHWKIYGWTLDQGSGPGDGSVAQTSK